MSRKLDADKFWDIIKSIKSPIIAKMATIDPDYNTGKPKIIIDGELKVGQKRYPYLSSYTPAANDRVELLNVGGTWVIQGKVI